jgi:hypothetical protein
MTRASIWLALLQRLTASTPGWGVWKSPRSALEGEGDVDSVAPAGEWETIVTEFRSWAREEQLGAVIVCRHIPGLLVLTACMGERPTRLLQLDVYAERVFRGAPLFRAAALRELMEKDSKGFRRLRPGAEGLLHLFGEGLRAGGRPPGAGTARTIGRLLRDDPEGVRQASGVLGARGPSALAVANALARGGWDRRAALQLESRSLLELLRDPRQLTVSVRRDLRLLRPCGVLRALEAGRTIPGDPGPWLARESASHTVYDPA